MGSPRWRREGEGGLLLLLITKRQQGDHSLQSFRALSPPTRGAWVPSEAGDRSMWKNEAGGHPPATPMQRAGVGSGEDRHWCEFGGGGVLEDELEGPDQLKSVGNGFLTEKNGLWTGFA